MKIPKINYPEIQLIIKNAGLSNGDKAKQIRSQIYYIYCRETDGRTPALPAEETILKALEENQN